MSADTSLPVCYRHVDRETRLACSACGRPICLDCMATAAVGQKCPDCAAQQGRGRVVHAAQLRRGGGASAPVSMALLVVCTGVFVVGFLASPVGQALYETGAQANQRVAGGEWYRLFSAAFLHSPFALTHILFNMWALWVFGPDLERQVGSVPFAALYMASALTGGAAFYLLVPGGVAVGASGAIFGLFGAWLAAAWRNRATPAGQAGLRQLLMLLGLNLALPLIVPGIAWQAHLGGLVAGFVVASLWSVGPLRTSAAARAVLGVTVAALALGAVLLG